ncbi:helix-turn-helix domain-containing protein [Flavobacterium pectinovorum]|uniref:helix-turn-helix domain-containing protein n=1 Tax=Flavobacterium pectinovorum TaxID=29533 RepID=UPI001FAC438B|nr:helix-turn-helix transcriptional regulator [Flavobacterium pectinovorum]MCI9844544.1 helix-turn-helix transcriptional regulator [Flavobacterium pectinovorum]
MIQDFINREDKEASSFGFDINQIRKYKINTLDTSFVTHRFSILLIKSGNFKIEVQEIILNLIASDIIMIPENSICVQMGSSRKLEIFIISFTSNFAFKNFIKKEIIGLLYLFMKRNMHKISLNETDFLVLSLMSRLICILKNESENNGIKSGLMKVGVDFFFYELAIVCSKYENENNLGFSNRDSLILHFLLLLSNKGIKEHTVNFYAESLCVTPGYLNKIVKQKTGRTIKALIAEIIIVEAKKMLRENEVSITGISQKLQFSNISAFCTFFKKHMAISPSEYRSDRISPK